MVVRIEYIRTTEKQDKLYLCRDRVQALRTQHSMLLLNPPINHSPIAATTFFCLRLHFQGFFCVFVPFLQTEPLQIKLCSYEINLKSNKKKQQQQQSETSKVKCVYLVFVFFFIRFPFAPFFSRHMCVFGYSVLLSCTLHSFS